MKDAEAALNGTLKYGKKVREYNYIFKVLLKFSVSIITFWSNSKHH